MDSANLKESLEIFETLKKTLPDPFFIIDSNGFYLEVFGGAENIFYDSVKYLKGKNIKEIMPLDKSDHYLQLINESIEHKKIKVVEYSLSSAECFGNPKDGPKETQWFEGRIYPLEQIGQKYLKAVVWLVINITERKKAEAEKDELIHRLEKAFEEINVYKQLIPICSYCKKIRDKEDKWHSFESYLRKTSDISFSHGICPECVKKLYPNLKIDKK
ncbi:MAG: PAS domain S-box protein [Desulforegulaceae bacterium]|nr:PAS domain S-box protein [Desulforegulaceae bacterium]